MRTDTIAPLVNVSLAMAGMKRAQGRDLDLPGLVVMHGPSGWGKTTAAIYAANKTRAYHVQGRSTWTRKAMLEAILKEMAIQPARTINEMVDQVAEQLNLSGRPLIIDEMDHLVERKLVEVVRDVYEASQAAILLIGEELLPTRLRAWERFHGRVLDWVGAQPAGIDDARVLAQHFCDVQVGHDLLAEITDKARGSVRRIRVNLAQVEEFGRSHGLEMVDKAAYTGQIFTGEAPRRKVAA